MSSYCVFNIGDRRVGIPMASVREILDLEFIVPTPIPLVPEFVHGLFNLRGQVLPFLDIAGFVGAQATKPSAERRRAVIVENGEFRFATLGLRIDTVEADDATRQPVDSAALHPALDAEVKTDRGRFHIIHLDRLEACLKQSLKATDGAELARPVVATSPSHPGAQS